MAGIKVSDAYKDSLFTPVFNIEDGNAKVTKHTSVLAQSVYSIDTNITIEGEGLDRDVQVTLKQGNNEDYDAIGALVDADNKPIVLTVGNGGRNFTVKLTGFFFGVELDTLTAITGKVKIYARL